MILDVAKCKLYKVVNCTKMANFFFSELKLTLTKRGKEKM